MEIIYIIIGLILLLLIFSVIIFNSLISLKTLVEEAWSGIDVQLKRRYDLIPQLIEAVKTYISFEEKTLTDISQIRNQSMQEENLSKKSELEDKLSSQIHKVSILVENYPQLKSSENIIKLMNQLFEIEDQIQLSRRYYNGSVRNYNIKVKVFPQNILAKIFNFSEKSFFEADENAKQDVKVNL